MSSGVQPAAGAGAGASGGASSGSWGKAVTGPGPPVVHGRDSRSAAAAFVSVACSRWNAARISVMCGVVRSTLADDFARFRGRGSAAA